MARENPKEDFKDKKTSIEKNPMKNQKSLFIRLNKKTRFWAELSFQTEKKNLVQQNERLLFCSHACSKINIIGCEIKNPCAF